MKIEVVFMDNIKEIFHEILSKLPVREFERRTFNMKRFLKNGYL